MRYIMKQKLLSWGDDFRIKDATGTDTFFVDGKALSFRDKLSFEDMQGQELAFIRQKLLSWGPTYEIYRNDQLAAVVKKQLFTFFRCKFTVDVPGPNDLEAKGRETWQRRHHGIIRNGRAENFRNFASLRTRTPRPAWPA